MPTFYPASYFGGPIYSLLGLCNALARDPRIKLRVLTTNSAGLTRNDRFPVQSFPVHHTSGYDIYYCDKSWGKEFSLSLLAKLYPMVAWADVVHLTSVYSFTTLPTLLLCRLMRKPLVWSPRGQLQRWQGSTRPRLKRVWEAVCNGLIHPKRCVLHVTSQDEAEESGRRITRAGMEIIENGVEIPESIPLRVSLAPKKLRLLFIGRLHPKKGIENLLRALNHFDDNVSLIICGTGETDYESSLRRLTNDLRLSVRVKFSGQVDGEKKSQAFWDADICIVPSYTENFAMVVAEALAHGVPVIASVGTPWRELTQHQCGLWIKNDPTSLVQAIEKMRSQDLNQMGENGRRWMQQSFSWTTVAKRMHAVYADLADGNA